MDTFDSENDDSCHSLSAKAKNSKHSVKSAANPGRHRSNGKSHKKTRYSAPKASSRTSKYKRVSSSSSVDGTSERKRQNGTEGKQTRQRGRCRSNSPKSSNTRSMTHKEGESKAGKSNTRKIVVKDKPSNSIFLSNSHNQSYNKNCNFSKNKARIKTSSRINKGKSVKFHISPETGGATSAKSITGIKRTSPRKRCNKRLLGKGKYRAKEFHNSNRGKRDSKSYARIPIRSLIKDQDVHKLPCGDDGKWKYIRMYQERARRREARRRRKRQKEREDSGGRKSSRRQRKSKKRSKSKRRRKSRSRSKRRKSTGRRRSAKSSTRRRRKRSR